MYFSHSYLHACKVISTCSAGFCYMPATGTHCGLAEISSSSLCILRIACWPRITSFLLKNSVWTVAVISCDVCFVWNWAWEESNFQGVSWKFTCPGSQMSAVFARQIFTVFCHVLFLEVSTSGSNLRHTWHIDGKHNCKLKLKFCVCFDQWIDKKYSSPALEHILSGSF